MISLVNVLRDCLSIIACLICVWSHACPWSHLLARSLCHPLFHLINLSKEVITPCVLAKSLVFSGTLTFDRLIARSLARPLSRLLTFSLAYWLARSQSYWSTPKTEQKTSSRLGWVAGKPFTVACMFPIACSYVFFSLACLPIPTHLFAIFCLYCVDIEALAIWKSEWARLRLSFFSCVIVRLLAHFLFVIRSLASSNQNGKSNRRLIGSKKKWELSWRRPWVFMLQ